MSLFKQIALSISIFLMIVLGTILILNFKSSQSFIQNQLHSNAEDTAASLALALGGVVSDDDNTVMMETMIAAIYDRGYYESITLYTPEDAVMIEKSQEILVKDVPTWFIDNVDLAAAPARSDVSGGWSSFGTVAVKSHVGHAYVQLWRIFSDLVQTFLLLAVVFLLLLSLMIKIILRALKDIELQAKAIQDNDFIIYDKVPFTTEFRHVVRAMNAMVKKVKEIFDKEAESLKKYHELLYTDTVTKLYNRRYLLMKLGIYLEPDSSNCNGLFVMFSLDDLEKAKAKLGYVKLETLIKNIASLMEDFTISYDQAIASRMNDQDFAFLIPGLKIDESQESFDTLMKNLAKLFEDNEVSEELVISAGVIEYTPDDNPKTLFSRADFELSKSAVKRNNSISFAQSQESEGIVLGKEEWVEMINASLDENMLKVASQAVIGMTKKNKSYHDEVYLRLLDEKGTIYNAGYFMPMLVKLKLTDDVDKHVVLLTMHHAKKIQGIESIAINISTGFLKDHANMQWLRKEIKAFAKESDVVLNFEASKFTVTKNIDLYADFSGLLHHLGYRFGIDNFSIDQDGLHYLQTIKPDYIKASKSFFFDLKGENNANAYDSLSILTGSLGITLIATSVESEEDMQKLADIGIEYIQGSYIANPQILGA